MLPNPPAPARLTAQPLAWRDPLDAFAPLADQPMSLLLHGGPGGRSFIMTNPLWRAVGPPDAARLAAVEARWRAARRPPVDIFPGAFAGLFAYELAAALDPPSPTAGPAALGLAVGDYRAAAAFDMAEKRLAAEGEGGAAEDLAGCLGSRALAPPPAPAARAAEPALPRAAYEAHVARAIAAIRAGDLYQVNLSQRFTLDLAPGDEPYDAFRRLVAASPAPFAAFLRVSETTAIAAHSPELFLRLDAEGAVESRPIKGTRPRGATPDEDARLAAELAQSAKDRAENLMIVDLMRNDLARVCRPGSVRAGPLFARQTWPSVHHLVSTIEGVLAPGRDAFDLLRAAFPPGSVTGAPKRAAMALLAALEGEPRGPYCGALGYLRADGLADLNVMIRSILFERSAAGWRATFRAGGGVVADSDPGAEYQETLVKAAAIARALGGLALTAAPL